MRILMLNNEFPPLGGGTGTANHALLRNFAKIPELEVDLITSALGKNKEEEKFSEHIRIFKVPVRNKNLHHSSNRELLSYAARAFRVAWQRQRARHYDLCFAWSAVPAGFIALALRKFTGLPYLVRVCGPDIPGFEERYQPLYPVLSPVIRAIWHNAAAVVAKSEGEREMIHALDSAIDVTLVPNGVDLNTFRPGVEIPDGGPLRLLCVARLIERKGQHHLIEAVKRLVNRGVDVTLDLVGTGDARPKNEAQAERLGLNGRIKFLGYVPREEIARHYADAHVFILPSYNEGMSIATLEAMAAGLTIVTTRTPGMTELIEEGVNGFTFAWADVDALTKHLQRLATDRVLARRMGAASHSRAANFSWATPAALYLKVFESVALPTSVLSSKTQESRLIDSK